MPDLETILSELHAPPGIIAVMSNHDQKTDPALLERELHRSNITVLADQSIIHGPLARDGLDDPATARQRPATVLAAFDVVQGARLVAAHFPKPVWRLPHDGMLLLAGHTHSGQIVIPVLWQLRAKVPDFRCRIV